MIGPQRDIANPPWQTLSDDDIHRYVNNAVVLGMDAERTRHLIETLKADFDARAELMRISLENQYEEKIKKLGQEVQVYQSVLSGTLPAPLERPESTFITKGRGPDADDGLAEGIAVGWNQCLAALAKIRPSLTMEFREGIRIASDFVKKQASAVDKAFATQVHEWAAAILLLSPEDRVERENLAAMWKKGVDVGRSNLIGALRKRLTAEPELTGADLNKFLTNASYPTVNYDISDVTIANDYLYLRKVFAGDVIDGYTLAGLVEFLRFARQPNQGAGGLSGNLMIRTRDWAMQALGENAISDLRIRSLHLFTHACALMVASGIEAQTLEDSVRRAYSRPTPPRDNYELGNVLVASLLFAVARQFDPDTLVNQTLHRLWEGADRFPRKHPGK